MGHHSHSTKGWEEITEVRFNKKKKKGYKKYIPTDPKLVAIHAGGLKGRKCPRKPKSDLQKEIDSFYKK